MNTAIFFHSSAAYAVLVAVVSYCMGSLPSGYLIGRMHGKDLRREGSGNIGATNALRVLGKKWGYLVFAMDFLKGSFAVWLAGWGYFIFRELPGGMAISLAGIIAALFCMVGHVFPVWLGFKGGKGIATSGGIILALFPWTVFVVAVSTWIILFFVTRYVSIASICGSIMLPLGLTVCFIFGWHHVDVWLLGTGILMCALAVWRHRSNIQRLLNGTEPRFERKAKSA